MKLRVTVFSWVVLLFVWLPAQAQPVISARSGLVRFSEGAVSLDGMPIAQTFGKFAQMKDGSELATEDGRAEVMLTPGVYLRLGEDTTIRMVSNRLSDTRIEFLRGAAIVDSANASAKTPVTIVCMNYQVQLHEPGLYRFESIPAELRVDKGEAEVLHYGNSTAVEAQSTFSFIGGFTLRSSPGGPVDALDNWNRERNHDISASNDQAGKATDLSAALDSWQNDPNAALGALGMSGYLPPLPPPQLRLRAQLSAGQPRSRRFPRESRGIRRHEPVRRLPAPNIWLLSLLDVGRPRLPGIESAPGGLGYWVLLRSGGSGPASAPIAPPIGTRPLSPVYRSPGSIGRVGAGRVGGGRVGGHR